MHIPNRSWASSVLVLAWMLLPAGRVANGEGVFYYASSENGWESLLANARRISILAPQVFTANQEGQVTGAVEERIRLLAAQHGIRLMPLLVNEHFSPEVAHGVLSDARLRQTVISEAVRLCRQNGCWGLQLDFEGLGREDGKNYAQFVREAARAFRARALRFSVAVPSPLASRDPPQEGPGLRWGGFSVTPSPYDLREIARHVDFLTLMTYDENTPADPPGPIASYNWVEQSIRYVLRFVPRRKLSMGLGFYARQWCNQQVSESNFLEIASLAARTGASSRWHPLHRSPWLEIEGKDCLRIVWFENQASLREKLTLVRKYKLAGFSAWRLGQEDPAFWKAFPERRLREAKSAR